MTETWWGEVAFAEEEARIWRFGALDLVIRREAREWNLAHRWGEVEEPEAGWSVARVEQFPEDGWERARFLFGSTEATIRLTPLLADRPVITSPRVPLFVSPGEETVLFVGSPLWLRISAGEETLRELPIQRPSDTWFGSSTLEGELCYASRTNAVLDVENLPLLARRAVTPVKVRNGADEPLQIERLKLPVPLLSLFETPAGRVWTESVIIDRSDPSEMAEVQVRPGPPANAAGARLVTPPRLETEDNMVMRVFSTFGSIFRTIGEDDD